LSELKPLIVNATDIQGGAAIATYRLHQGLRRIGVDSSMLVQKKLTDDANVLGPQTRYQKMLGQLKPHLDQLWVTQYNNREAQLFSAAMIPDSIATKIQGINPDIVHLFWVADGQMRPETLRNLKKPIVWTLHDMWPFTGGCHYDGECGKYSHSCGACPVLHSSKESDLSRWIWRRKHNAWRNVDMTVVATSQWLAQCARSSSLFGDYRIEVLPNGIDESKYKPIDKAFARDVYGLPKDKRLILFSAGSLGDKRKGFQFLIPALQSLAKSDKESQVEAVIIGASKPDRSMELGMNVHYIGRLQDEISQVLLYSAADVLVAPSTQENLSNTVMESLACGTPVVAFNIGGMPDMIDHQKNGYLASAFDTHDLASGIMWVLESVNRRDMLSKNARQTVLERYTLEKVANQYRALYQSILDQPSKSPAGS